MSISGARGLIRIAHNLDCELQAAMVAERVKEPEFYRRLTGQDYPGEYGERVSARRRGMQFEANLHRNAAVLLRQALAPLYDFDPDQMVVRNLEDDVPGRGSQAQVARLERTRAILRDLARGQSVPDLVIHPQFQLAGGPTSHLDLIGPDYMVLDTHAGMYVPGEEKSFIVRENIADPVDLDSARRQAAAQVLALRAETRAVGLNSRVTNRAVFVFATPFGLSPSRPVEEQLDAEVFEIGRAVAALQAIRARLVTLRNGGDAPLEQLAEHLQTHFQEQCIAACALARVCKQNYADRAVALGDVAGDLLGGTTPIIRLIDLLHGMTPADDRERVLAVRLRDAASALVPVAQTTRRSA
jgi:hypothetical protein